MSKGKAAKCVDISKIEYLENDRIAIVNFAESFAGETLGRKKNNGNENNRFLAGLENEADKLLKESQELVRPTFSIRINQIIYHCQRLKRRTRERFFGENTELAGKLKKLFNIAVIIECGKLYERRKAHYDQDWISCLDISGILVSKKDYALYMNEGILSVVDFEACSYALNRICESFNQAYSSGNKRRKKNRVFYIHVGGTNSGKTYDSLQMLKSADSGAYLSPLRLLALEVSDSLNEDGIPCSLITGEEEHLVENATHVASTVEMADFWTEYEAVVIDECQMIADPIRGYAWTKAITNIRSREICLCTAPEALNVLKSLIDSCGDYYTVIEHERTTPLVVEDEAFDINSVMPGDALVAFSKKSVNAIGAQLIHNGVNVSVIYGALPYKARKKQYENFVNGTSSVLVTTDAIGMGVNLPIRRIVFMETFKFDGNVSRKLKDEEVKQIAGRAGRKGKFDTGYVNSYDSHERSFIKTSLESSVTEVKGICVNFPKQILKDENITFEDAFAAWALFNIPKPYIKESLEEAEAVMGDIADIYDKLEIPYDRLEMFNFSTMPIDFKIQNIRNQWLFYIEQRLRGDAELKKPDVSYISVREALDSSKKLDTYFLCSRSWNMYADLQWLDEQRRICNDVLIDGLIKDVEGHVRHCVSCGKPLEWNSWNGFCDECNDKYGGYPLWYFR